MNTSRPRILAVSGATLALVIAGTAAVSAHPGERGDQGGFGRDRGDQQFQRGDRGGPQAQRGLKAKLGAGGGIRGQLRQGIGDRLDRFVRRETIVELDEGLVTRRVDNGTATGTSEAGLEYTLATGETASVTTDDDTQIIAFSEQTVEVGRRNISRQRMVPAEITLADIEPGMELVVWAESQDDGTFLAQRIVSHPPLDTSADEADGGSTDSDDAISAPVSDA